MIIAGDAGFGNSEQEEWWVGCGSAYRAQSAIDLEARSGPLTKLNFGRNLWIHQ